MTNYLDNRPNHLSATAKVPHSYELLKTSGPLSTTLLLPTITHSLTFYKGISHPEIQTNKPAAKRSISLLPTVIPDSTNSTLYFLQPPTLITVTQTHQTAPALGIF